MLWITDGIQVQHLEHNVVLFLRKGVIYMKTEIMKILIVGVVDVAAHVIKTVLKEVVA